MFSYDPNDSTGLTTGMNNALVPFAKRADLVVEIEERIDTRGARLSKKPLIRRQASRRQQVVAVHYAGGVGAQRALVRWKDPSRTSVNDLIELDRTVHEIYRGWKTKRWAYMPSPIFQPEAGAAEDNPFLQTVAEAIADGSPEFLADLMLEQAQTEDSLRGQIEILAAKAEKFDEAEELKSLHEGELQRRIGLFRDKVAATTAQEESQVVAVFRDVLTAVGNVDATFTGVQVDSFAERMKEVVEITELRVRIAERLRAMTTVWDGLQEQRKPLAERFSEVDGQRSNLLKILRGLPQSLLEPMGRFRTDFSPDTIKEFVRTMVEQGGVALEALEPYQAVQGELEDLLGRIAAIEKLIHLTEQKLRVWQVLSEEFEEIFKQPLASDLVANAILLDPLQIEFCVEEPADKPVRRRRRKVETTPVESLVESRPLPPDMVTNYALALAVTAGFRSKVNLGPDEWPADERERAYLTVPPTETAPPVQDLPPAPPKLAVPKSKFKPIKPNKFWKAFIESKWAEKAKKWSFRGVLYVHTSSNKLLVKAQESDKYRQGLAEFDELMEKKGVTVFSIMERLATLEPEHFYDGLFEFFVINLGLGPRVPRTWEYQIISYVRAILAGLEKEWQLLLKSGQGIFENKPPTFPTETITDQIGKAMAKADRIWRAAIHP